MNFESSPDLNVYGIVADIVSADDEIDDEIIVSEDQVLVETDGDESTIEDVEPTDADTYLLFTKPVFEEKANIGKLCTLVIIIVFVIMHVKIKMIFNNSSYNNMLFIKYLPTYLCYYNKIDTYR